MIHLHSSFADKIEPTSNNQTEAQPCSLDQDQTVTEARLTIMVPNINDRAREIALSINKGIDLSKSTQDFAALLTQRCLKESERRAQQADPVQAASFLAILPEKVQLLITLINTINFSLSYELEGSIYPSDEDMKPIVDLSHQLQKKFEEFRFVKGFQNSFICAFSPFLEHLSMRIRTAAIVSREAKLKQLDTQCQNKEIIARVVTQAQIRALKENEGQHWHELRDILNLNKHPNKTRVPTRAELEFFKFVTTIFDLSQDPQGTSR
jgi:hypothetical protein